jgi:hypothetical protein
VVLADPVDHLRLHAGHGGGVVVPLKRAHLLVWLRAQVASSTRIASVATAPLQKRMGIPDLVTFASRNWTGSWQLRWRVWHFVRRRSLASVRHALCVSRTSAVSRVIRLIRNVGVFEVLGLDFCGPMSVPSMGGRRYNLCAVIFEPFHVT